MLLTMLLLAGDPIGVQVRTGPMRFQESTTKGKSTTTIQGPRGTRVIHSDEDAQTLELPGRVTTETNGHVQVDGVNDTGIVIQRKVYYPGNRGQVDVEPQITGGPGSIDSHSETTTTKTPQVEVQAR